LKNLTSRSFQSRPFCLSCSSASSLPSFELALWAGDLLLPRRLLAGPRLEGACASIGARVERTDRRSGVKGRMGNNVDPCCGLAEQEVGKRCG
jgi:hypothetical protein